MNERLSRDKMGYFSTPYIAEHHLFKRLGKTILFNGETMLFYEVTPVVFDLMTLLSLDPPPPNPIHSLQASYVAVAKCYVWVGQAAG